MSRELEMEKRPPLSPPKHEQQQQQQKKLPLEIRIDGDGENSEKPKQLERLVTDVAEARWALQKLSPRPDHEEVDSARARIAEIQRQLAGDADEAELSPGGREARLWREEAERERHKWEAVVDLDYKYGECQRRLREAEDRLLVKVSRSPRSPASSRFREVNDEAEMNEEAAAILRRPGPVERVDLPDRRLQLLPEAFGRLRSLLVLNLSSNLLQFIPDSIAGLEKLQELHLSGNCLMSLPDSIGLLLNLKVLNVSGNKLSALPDSMSHCRSLVQLDASFNELTYLPTNIGYELRNLEKLLIHLNKIRSLPSSMCEMRSLHHLDAHFNELSGLPQAIGKLTNLEILDVSSNFNDLTAIPDSIGDLANLRELFLSNNQIHALPDTFGRLEKLTKLDLDQNPLTVPPLEIVKGGVEVVKVYMAKRWLDILVAKDEQQYMIEANEQSETGLLTRSTSWLNTLVSAVSETMAGYTGSGAKSYTDPILDQEL